MTFLKEVEAIETSDGMLFSKSEYARAIKHEKMVQAGIEYQNIIAGDYLRDWINENQVGLIDRIDMISNKTVVSFAKALLVAASDHRQAMNEELPFEAIDGFDCADLDATELEETLDEIDSFPTEVHLIDEMSKHSDLVKAGLLSDKPLIEVYADAVEEHKRISEKSKVIAMSRPSRKNQVKAKKQPKPEESNETDSLYLEAVEAVRNGDIRPSGKALREKFGIRHDRAGEIMKCMERDGVVSEPVKGVRVVLK